MGRESVLVHWVVIVSPPPVVLRTTPPAKGGGHSAWLLPVHILPCHSRLRGNDKVFVVLGAGAWAFWGDHPGGVAATPPQRGTLFRDGARGSYCFSTPRRAPHDTPRQNHPRKLCLRGARAAVGIHTTDATNYCDSFLSWAVGIRGRPPRRCSRHPSAEGNFGCDGAGGALCWGSYCFTTPRRSGDRHPPPKAVGIQHL